MHADDEVRTAALLHYVDHSGHDVDVKTFQFADGDVDGHGSSGGDVQGVAPGSDARRVIVVAHIEGSHFAGIVGVAHQDGEVHDFLCRHGVGDGYHLACVLPFTLVDIFGQRLACQRHA